MWIGLFLGSFGPLLYAMLSVARSPRGSLTTVIGDRAFLDALTRSLSIGFTSSAASVLIALGLAAVASGMSPARARVVDLFVCAPLVLPPSTLAASWGYLLEPYTGPLAIASEYFGLQRSMSLLGSRETVVPILIIVLVISGTGWPYLLFRRAMDSIPLQSVEAAVLDGAGRLRVLFSITGPQMGGTIAAALSIQFVWGVLAFDQIKILTNGGPGTASEVVAIYVYRQAFVLRERELASAATLVAWAITGPIMVVLVLWQRAREHEPEGEAVGMRMGESLSVARLLPGSLMTRPLSTGALLGWLVLSVGPLAIICLGAASERGSLVWGTKVGWVQLQENLALAFRGPPFGEGFWKYATNSLLIALAAAAISLTLGFMAAYWLRYVTGVRRRLVLGVVIMAFAIPGIMAWIPAHELASRIGVLSQSWVLTILYAAGLAPMSVILADAALRSIPRGVLESASLDGASVGRSFRLIVIPGVRWQAIAVGTILLLQCWSEFGLASVLLRRQEVQTLPVAISQFRGQFQTNQGGEAASIVLSVVCVLVPALAVSLIAWGRSTYDGWEERRRAEG